MSCKKETKTKSPFKRVRDEEPPKDELVIFRVSEEDGSFTTYLGKNPKHMVAGVEEKYSKIPIAVKTARPFSEITLQNGTKEIICSDYDLEWIALPPIMKKGCRYDRASRCNNCRLIFKKLEEPWTNFEFQAPPNKGLILFVELYEDEWRMLMAKNVEFHPNGLKYVSTHTIKYIDDDGEKRSNYITDHQTWWVKLPEESCCKCED